MRMTTLAVVLTAIVALPAVASAQGASGNSPGHQMRDKGSVKGSPGASGYAPGRMMKKQGSVEGTRGAYGYAPGYTTRSGRTTTRTRTR